MFSVTPDVSIHPGTVRRAPNQGHDFLLRRSRRRRLVGSLAGAVVAVVLGGIGGIRAWSGDTHQSPTGSGGVVMISATGILRAVGGPANVGPRGLPGTVVFMNGGATVGRARAGSDGRFTIRRAGRPVRRDRHESDVQRRRGHVSRAGGRDDRRRWVAAAGDRRRLPRAVTTPAFRALSAGKPASSPARP